MKKLLFFCFSLVVVNITVKAQPFTPSIEFSNKVINSFKQGSRGDFNCASIAVIKCTIATYGLDNVWKQATWANGGVSITLRNNDTVSLTSAELKLASDSCGFVLMGDTAILNKSIILYTVLGKRAIHNPSPIFAACTDYQSALRTLHHGINAINLPTLLGVKSLNVRHASQVSYVYGTGYHAVFASINIFDDYGRRRRINILNWRAHIGINPITNLTFTNFMLVDQG